MTRQLVWIDTEKERVVPVEPTPDELLNIGQAFSKVPVISLGVDFTVEEWQAVISIASSPTPVSLPSEEEFCKFWAREIDELDFNTLPETDKDRVDGLGACKDDYREYYRAILKLLTEKGEKNAR